MQPLASVHDDDKRAGKTRREPTGERGRRRRELILDTAARLLAEGGPEAITTNTLAARADIAVGSVYQYFANKEAIMAALGERYLEELGRNTVAALDQDLSGLTISEMVDRVIDPMIAFERSHPAFALLNSGPEGGATLAESARRVDQEVLATIHNLLLRVRPTLDTTTGWRIAMITKALYKGISYLIQQENSVVRHGGDVDDLIADMKQVMAGYLEARMR